MTFLEKRPLFNLTSEKLEQNSGTKKFQSFSRTIEEPIQKKGIAQNLSFTMIPFGAIRVRMHVFFHS